MQRMQRPGLEEGLNPRLCESAFLSEEREPLTRIRCRHSDKKVCVSGKGGDYGL